MERFDNKSLFENDFTKGINLFLGAGFSVNAKASMGKPLPVGNSLVDELKVTFNLHLDLPLPQFSTILEKTKR